MSADRKRHATDLATQSRRPFRALRASRARSVLGPDHPLSRSTELVHTLAIQATATAGAAALGAIAVAERRFWGTALLSAAVSIELALLAILAFARQVQREDILRVIAGGHENLPLEEVAHEARRLERPLHKAQLARRLERALDEARRWHRIAVASRPPEGVKLLHGFSQEINEIVRALRRPAPALRGVATLELFLIGGYGSALYTGDKEELQQQLWRTRYLLSPLPSPRQSPPVPIPDAHCTHRR